jgi:hypothetical protein
MKEVAFKDFAKLARERGYTIESLADRFRRKIENPSEFFDRLMTCRHRGIALPCYPLLLSPGILH